MVEVKTAVLIAVVVIVWTPFLIFIGSDLLRWFRDRRDCRRLARRLRADAAAYRDLDLSQPLGRSRLGIPTQEDDR